MRPVNHERQGERERGRGGRGDERSVTKKSGVSDADENHQRSQYIPAQDVKKNIYICGCFWLSVVVCVCVRACVRACVVSRVRIYSLSSRVAVAWVNLLIMADV